MIETELPRAPASRWPWLLAVCALAGLVAALAWRSRGAETPPPSEVAASPSSEAVARWRANHPGEPMAVQPESTEEERVQEDAGAPREGLAAFPPPGTKRIKVGLVVPEDFQLPSGYMRHYQTTDKGEMLRAILMFHPDYKPADPHGNPIPIPEDRIVPPELAPPGMPMERLEVPEDAYADAGPR
ncbi:hypothetical protein LVJ94_01085 [Pendulispora rubella]|uniref:Uncharacterized protein n=1 Tax=Pendulispora rubella TaxID=2741070 RepID=A0ABZ2L4I0_9BACT